MLSWQLEKQFCPRARCTSNSEELANDATMTDPRRGGKSGGMALRRSAGLLSLCPEPPQADALPRPQATGCPVEGVCSRRAPARGACVHHERGQGGDHIPARAWESYRPVWEGNTEGNRSCQGPRGRRAGCAQALGPRGAALGTSAIQGPLRSERKTTDPRGPL